MNIVAIRVGGWLWTSNTIILKKFLEQAFQRLVLMEIIISPRLLGNFLTNLLQDVKGRYILVSCWRYGLRGGGLISKLK